MKKYNTNKYLIIGSLSAFIYFGVGHFVRLPDIIGGFCIGISIVMNLIGAYALNHDIRKLQNAKKKFISNIQFIMKR